MTGKQSTGAGTFLLVTALLFEVLSSWDTVIDHLPEALHPYAASRVLPLMCSIAAVVLLWRAARLAAEMERQAREGLQMAITTNAALQQRVEAAEKRLIQALDEQVINWAPALTRIEEETSARIYVAGQNAERHLFEVWSSFRRRAERGYLPGDDLAQPPPSD